MVTVAHIVRKQMENKPFIQECINKGLINYGALAEYLQGEVEHEMGKQVKLLTISMALRRLEEEYTRTPLSQLVIDKNTDLTTKSHLVEYVVRKSDTLLRQINRFYSEVDVVQGDLLSFNQGTMNMTILTNERHANQLDNLLSGEKIVSKRTGLGAIFMAIPPESRDVPGFYFILSRSLAFNNVTILTLTNIDSEVLFLFNNRDLSRAHSILFDLIQSNLMS